MHAGTVVQGAGAARESRAVSRISAEKNDATGTVNQS
jgi:hypothetical protein